MNELTHFDESGASRMVDVGDKPVTSRRAVASSLVRMKPATLASIQEGGLAKGDVLEVARLAGIMAAKRTGDLIPLCHPLPIEGVEIDFQAVGDDCLGIEVRVKTTGKTGIEMEALTAASVAALTLYDMVKSADRGVVIERTRLESKAGGNSGNWTRREGA